MGNESVNLIVTDPPYNLNKDYGTSQDKLKFEEYLEFSRLWLREAKRVLKPDGTIYIFMGMKYISDCRQSPRQMSWIFLVLKH